MLPSTATGASELNPDAAPQRLGVSSAPAPAVVPDLPLERSASPYTASGPYGSPQRQVASDRRLSGVAFSRESVQSLPAAAMPADGPEAETTTIPTFRNAGGQLAPGARSEGGLTTLLRPSVTTPARAQMLPTQQFLLPKGAFIDCTLETAIDSTLPGMTTCVTATDTFGVDGKVVLLERGSKLVGETRGEVQNGAARVFVLWTEARTPTGVLVPLDSPGTDELGRAGLPGEVNRHFWDRFGAAMLISVIDGAVQAAVQSSARGGGAIIYNPSTSQNALTDVLKGTINIPPTVVKRQGERIQILVARDLDFRPVYELRATGF
jgi:type IV secretion system protein VirB10